MSVVVVVSPPAADLVGLDEAKQHLGVDHDDDDDLIKGLVAAAVSWIDGPDGWLGRALLNQELELLAEGFPACSDGEIDLPYPPVASVTSVAYTDPDGVERQVADGGYALVGSRLAPAFGEPWPNARSQRAAVRIRYVAGYGEDPATVPTGIRLAIKMLAAHWYANREAVGPDTTVELPLSVEALLGPFRVWRA